MGTKFKNMAEDYICPVCSARKKNFKETLFQLF